MCIGVLANCGRYIIKNKSQKYHFSKKGPNMKKKLYFVANFHFNMEDNVYAYNSWSSFGDSGKVLHLPLSGFSFMHCKKKTTGKCQAYWRCFCYRKRDYPEYPKRPQIFHRRGFLVTQINTEYSEDISQLRLENDCEQKF